MDMKKLKKLVNIKIVNFKKENRDPEKLPKFEIHFELSITFIATESV